MVENAGSFSAGLCWGASLLEAREERLAAEKRQEGLRSVYRHVLPPNYE